VIYADDTAIMEVMPEPDEGVDLIAALEAILFSSQRALTMKELQNALETNRQRLNAAVDGLMVVLSQRGVMVQRHGDQVQLVTRPDLGPFVRRAVHPEVAGRLTPAAYETLAIVAYQQPVARSRVEEIRGVNCESVLGNLELRGLVAETGRGSGPGQPKLYGTTMRFLQLVGLGSVSDLPQLADEAEEETSAQNA
jgi:segregation and condensation protein B